MLYYVNILNLRLIKAGLTNNQIVKTLRKDFSPENSRLHMVVDKDITNIRRQRSLFPGRLHEDDLTSVMKRIEQGNHDDGFVHFQPAQDAKGTGLQIG